MCIHQTFPSKASHYIDIQHVNTHIHKHTYTRNTHTHTHKWYMERFVTAHVYVKDYRCNLACDLWYTVIMSVVHMQGKGCTAFVGMTLHGHS